MANGTVTNGLSNGGPTSATSIANGTHGTALANGQTNGISGTAAGPNGASASQPPNMQTMPGGQRMVRDIYATRMSGFSRYQHVDQPRLKAHRVSSPIRRQGCQAGSNP